MPTKSLKTQITNILKKLQTTKQAPVVHPKRKYSDTISVESNSTLTDKIRNKLKNNRYRRKSSLSSEISESNFDYLKAFEKFQALYLLSIDELNYAEDSQGSPYYSGDLATAREVFHDCKQIFIQLLENIFDPITRESLELSMTPKLLKLQHRLDSLPDID